MKKDNNENGNVALLVFLILIVVVAVLVIGIYITKHNHKTTTTKTTSTTTSPPPQISKTTTQTDTYAGWKSYCDGIYNYCFKYPSTWSIDANAASSIGHTAQTTLLNASKSVSVSYINAFVHDSKPIAFTPTHINKIKSANEDLTVLGGYSPEGGPSGNYLTTYKVVDTSLLNTYPLILNQQSQFPNNPNFTDQNTGNVTYQGEFTAEPTTSINTATDAQTWLNSSDGKTAFLILESIYYQK